MSLFQGAGPFVVPPGVVVLHFVKDLTKVPVIGSHKIGCCNIALLGPLRALSVKFGKCISCICSVSTSYYINFLLDEMDMHPYGSSNLLYDIDYCLVFIQLVSNKR